MLVGVHLHSKYTVFSSQFIVFIFRIVMTVMAEETTLDTQQEYNPLKRMISEKKLHNMR